MIRLAAAALLASLLAGTAMAQAPATPSTTGAAAAGAATGAASATGKAATSASSSTKSATKAATAKMTGEFADEASAKAHCPGDTVVWANTSSKAYHLAGTKYYGKTKKGAYMCQKDADAAGFHAPKAKTASAKPASAAKTN